VAFNHLKQSGMFAILDKHLSRRASAIMQELIIHQMIYPNSKVKFCHQRESGIMYLLGGKRSFKEDSVYAAMDELENKFGLIKQSLYEKLPSTNDKLLLYDLSNSYFTGNKAELGGRGDSKEKRHDRFIVTYGLVTNQDNMPLDIKIWKGGTADSKTVLKTFSEWKAYYNTTKAIWVADRSMSGEPTIDEIKQLGLNYITGLPGQAQRALLMIEHGSQPELFDQQGIASINHNGGRYILCRHQSKGYRKEIQAARHRRKIFEQLKKIQNSPQNKDNKKIYHRAMKVIEKYEQTGLWIGFKTNQWRPVGMLV
jgi:transposase